MTLTGSSRYLGAISSHQLGLELAKILPINTLKNIIKELEK